MCIYIYIHTHKPMIRRHPQKMQNCNILANCCIYIYIYIGTFAKPWRQWVLTHVINANAQSSNRFAKNVVISGDWWWLNFAHRHGKSSGAHNNAHQSLSLSCQLQCHRKNFWIQTIHPTSWPKHAKTNRYNWRKLGYPASPALALKYWIHSCDAHRWEQPRVLEVISFSSIS